MNVKVALRFVIVKILLTALHALKTIFSTKQENVSTVLNSVFATHQITVPHVFKERIMIMKAAAMIFAEIFIM